MIKQSPSATAEGLFFDVCSNEEWLDILYEMQMQGALRVRIFVLGFVHWIFFFLVPCTLTLLLVNAFLKSISFFYTHPKSFTLPT